MITSTISITTITISSITIITTNNTMTGKFFLKYKIKDIFHSGITILSPSSICFRTKTKQTLI